MPPAIPKAYFTLWGAETAGLACPINYLLGEEHIAELIDAAQINILVVLGPNAKLDIWSRLAHLKKHCPPLKHVLAVGGAEDAADFDALLAAGRPADLEKSQPLCASDVVALFHTGGTTGRPKLARHTHRNQLHAAWGAACLYGATENDVVLNGFPLFHVAGAFVYGLSTLLADSELMKQPFLINNRAGEGGQIAAQFVAKNRSRRLHPTDCRRERHRHRPSGFYQTGL